MRSPWLLGGAACVLAAALSLVLVPAAPGYDAWAWLLWGREVGRLELDTVAGPAWKPLPVLVTALLAPAGTAAPELWLLVARAGALAAVALGVVVGRRLSGGSVLAGGVAAAGIVLTGGFVRHAAVGDSEPLLVALLLGAALAGVDGRHRVALGLGAAAALVRPEVWPFLGLYALWRRHDERPLLLGLAVLVPAAWFLPELWGSGELLRSTDRARIPNPGQPATADVPFLETLSGAGAVVLLPLAVLALFTRGPARLLAGAGVGWLLLVAAMSQAGFSGEPRYLVPGAALLAVAGACRIARRDPCPNARPDPVVVAGVAVAVAFAVPRVGELVDLGPRLAHARALTAGLERAVAVAGGPDRVLACGRPAVGRYRGTMLAWELDVPKRLVRADGGPGGATFRSRLTPRSPAAPQLPAGPARTLAVAGGWRVVCAA